VFLLVVDPAHFAGSVERLAGQFESLRDEHQVRLPAVEMTSLADSVEIDPEALRRLQEATRG
jgi:(2R)-3-sulfolactate dehydrogenase (NADP+)